MFGAKLCVHYWEVIPCSEGPLSEVPLYIPLVIDYSLTFGSVCRYCSPKLNLLTKPSNNGKCLLDIFSVVHEKITLQSTIILELHVASVCSCKHVQCWQINSVYLSVLYSCSRIHHQPTIFYTGDTKHFCMLLLETKYTVLKLSQYRVATQQLLFTLVLMCS